MWNLIIRGDRVAAKLGLSIILAAGLGIVAFACAARSQRGFSGNGHDWMLQLSISGATNTTTLRMSNEVVAIVGQYRSELLSILGARVGTEPLSVHLVNGLASNNVAITSTNGVSINTAYFLFQDINPLNLTNVLVHELVHFYTRFPGTTPSYWTEGVADYARYKLALTNDWSGPGCSAEYPHYKSGYWCAGAMLLWLDHEYGSETIRTLIRKLTKRNFSDAYFQKLTGLDIETLWTRFQKTTYATKSISPEKSATELNVEATAAFRELVAANALPDFPPGAHGYFWRTNLSLNPIQRFERTFTFFPDKGTNMYFYVVRKAEGEWKIQTNWSVRTVQSLR